MSSKPMRDAQLEAVAEADHALQADIVGNEPARDAEPGTGPEAVTGPSADSGTAAGPGQDGAAGPAAAEEAAAAEPVNPIEMAEPAELTEPVDEARPRRRGHGLLIGVVFLVAAFAIIGGAFAIVSHLTHGFKKPVIITYKKSAIFSLRTGECIDPHGQQAASLVPCANAHDAEVFATFTLPASKWPGAAAVSAAARSGCSSRLTGYLNPQLAISLSTTFVYPDSVAWQAGTRKVICEVRATSGSLTGSVHGATAG